jgi:hypothetical protein
MPNEDNYRRWKGAVFGSDYMIWHDGLDVSAVQSLTGDARENALGMLHKGVELKDPDAAQALAAMGEVSAVAEMRVQLRQSSGENKVRLALAIHALSPDESLANELIEVLENASLHRSTQTSAAIGLRNFGDSASERALLDAIEHNGNFLVRYHASESLLLRWRVVPSDISQHLEIFELIGSPQTGVIAADEQARLSEAIVRLEKLRKRDG